MRLARLLYLYLSTVFVMFSQHDTLSARAGCIYTQDERAQLEMSDTTGGMI